MLTLRELLKALNQIAIDREDLLDKQLIGFLNDSEGVYHIIGIVDVIGSYHDQSVELEFVEN